MNDINDISKTIHVKKFEELEDEEIVNFIHLGDNEAYDFLIQKYRKLVFTKTRTYFIIGGDREDIVQEGMIGLFKAIRDYKKDKLNSFKSFAELCIKRQIITAIKAATRQKHIPLNSYVSLDKPIYDEESNRTLMDMVTNSQTLDPQELVINQEEYKNIETEILELFTNLEREVLFLYLDGQSYKEISIELNSHVKAIDNALTRVKRKLEKYLMAQESFMDYNNFQSLFNIKNLNLSNYRTKY